MGRPINPDISKRIVASAISELGHHPPDSVSLRGIAKQAGVSPTTIYYYFASKDELFERIKFDAMAELEDWIRQAIAGETQPLRCLKLLLRGFAAWCLDRPYLAKLLMEDLPPKQDLDPAGFRQYYAIFLQAEALVEAGQRQGFWRVSTPKLDCSVMQAAIWGVVSQFRSKRVHPDYWDDIDPLIDRLIEIYFPTELPYEKTHHRQALGFIDRRTAIDGVNGGLQHQSKRNAST